MIAKASLGLFCLSVILSACTSPQASKSDVALGTCGAKVSTLLWFYETSVAQGRNDLAPLVRSLTAQRNIIKAEAESRAVNDKNQDAHDSLVSDVKSC